MAGRLQTSGAWVTKVDAGAWKQEKKASFEEANPGLIEFLTEASSWSDFAASLLSSYKGYGQLTERQADAAHSMRAKCEAARVAKERAAQSSGGVDLGKIRDMFEAAKKSGLKTPGFRTEVLTLSRAPDYGNNPGAIYVKKSGTYCGKVVGVEFKATREATPDVLEELRKIAQDPLGKAVEFGRNTGTCACCGRELTNGESIRLGIGPICREKWGLV